MLKAMSNAHVVVNNRHILILKILFGGYLAPCAVISLILKMLLNKSMKPDQQMLLGFLSYFKDKKLSTPSKKLLGRMMNHISKNTNNSIN